MSKSTARPLSPHLQIYRPQLTSVLSFAHRLTGVMLGIYATALVASLTAAAAGSQPYSMVQNFMRSVFGQVLLVGGIFCFFLHLCGGIRHANNSASYGTEEPSSSRRRCADLSISRTRTASRVSTECWA
jgi:succinate dehydrogenase cytochrome b subunit